MSGGAAALSMAATNIPRFRMWPGTSDIAALRETLAVTDWVPDLGRDIGSFTWFRGVATLCLLCGVAISALPSFGPVAGVQPPVMSAGDAEILRSQMITPLAFGADTGSHMAATDAVRPLAASPERPSIELTATLGEGDSLRRVLQRAGVAGGEADQVSAMVSSAVSLSDIASGTRIAVTLGRRPGPNQARPLDYLAFRARFDLNLELNRDGGGLKLKKLPIMVDDTPLRIRGTVGSSLYRSARAAGAPTAAVQKYLQVLGSKMSIARDVGADDEFDIILSYRRSEAGETEVGDLMYAGLNRNGKPRAQLLKWVSNGETSWFEASGVGQSRGEMVRPSNGRITSGFGMRRHPILRYMRMHSGLDFGASYGSAIYAVTDGRVIMAGRNGGYGNFVKLQHGGGLASGYGHMSRIAVRAGSFVRKGQIIGYVGSTGLSTGPHLHYELYRGGRAINPMSVKFVEHSLLTGRDLLRFKGELRRLQNVTPGAALNSLKSAAPQPEQAAREIDRLNQPLKG